MTPATNQVVNIVEHGDGSSGWICDPCTEKRVAGGEAVRILGQTERPCEDGCWRGVKSPTVDCVPTSLDERPPVPKPAPAKPMEPWPRYMKRKADEMAAAKGRAA